MTELIEGELVSQPLETSLTKHDEITVRRLEAAFNNLLNITEACRYAKISRETYYQWLGDDDVFSYRMSIAQAAPNQKAKSNIMKSLEEGDVNTSKWLLERKDPDFKPKAVFELPEDQQRTEEKLKEFLDDTNDGAYPDTSPENDGSTELATETEPDSGDEVAPGPTDIS